MIGVPMDASLISFFTNIAGPWGLVGLLLFLYFMGLRKDDKSIREALELQVKYFDGILASLTRIETNFTNHDIRVITMTNVVSTILDKVKENSDKIDRVKEVVPIIESKIRSGA
jgi:hypothetical protein